MARIFERIGKAQDIMGSIGPHQSPEDQLREVKKVLAFVLQELGDLAVKVDTLSKGAPKNG